MRLDIWSDIVCPWCYIGKRRFERALAGFEHGDAVEIVHRSFQLDPSSPRGAVRDHRQGLMAKYGLSESQAADAQLRMERTAAEEGLEFHLVGGVTGNTFDAHRLMHLAKDLGMQEAVIERLYRAHFTEQRSIFDVESLVVLAGEAGVDPPDARRVLEDETYGDAVVADSAEARRLGVTGVPFFVLDDRHGLSGAQPSEVFVDALALAWGDREQLTR